MCLADAWMGSPLQYVRTSSQVLVDFDQGLEDSSFERHMVAYEGQPGACVWKRSRLEVGWIWQTRVFQLDGRPTTASGDSLSAEVCVKSRRSAALTCKGHESNPTAGRGLGDQHGSPWVHHQTCVVF